jgi:hypothetical protein
MYWATIGATSLQTPLVTLVWNSLIKKRKDRLRRVREKHRNLGRRSSKKMGEFFQLVSTLFYEVKRGFVDRKKIVPLK